MATQVPNQTANDLRPAHSIPLLQRLPRTNVQKLKTYALVLFFFLCLLPIHLAQLFYYPMSFVPGGIRECYWWGIEATKESFGRLLLLISAPTTLVITGGEGVDLDKVVKKDKESGKLILKLEDRSVLITNHQQYADWCFMFCLLYLADLTGGLVIFLKASLRNVPMAGPAMRLWKFIFLQNWEKDRVPTGEALGQLGRRAVKHERKLAVLLYPEGTLVSALTRPKSRAYAEKKGVPDMKNQLLPRSTGLLYSLRTLKQHVPDLALYDITVGYPGMPPAAFAQSYYSLASVYTASQGPPQVHLHLRRYDLPSLPTKMTPASTVTTPPPTEADSSTASTGITAPPTELNPDPVPIGSSSFSSTLSPPELDDALTAEERDTFDLWLRERWTEKDALLDGFYANGHFEAAEDQRREIKLELRGIDDWLAIGSCYVAVYAAYRMIKWAAPRVLIRAARMLAKF